ncbi:swi5-dependent recombination DNA repair protein 1 homolog [Hemicordylus capensis]|uniref:swi5-dependent recombination DNA repair protein 1 homolog n=1 Tax=Hemicordylus capensis TaxID=884348 RepID=UPI0023024B0B|nr:swi5-dependent recombination DNA repair protein 1 homolog [Hemicordylus capensis]XP_053162424.1 swi5-dependent recombination DNA repair protein 1 homolog [Hemicordylus capensis]XP_053162425.1 swi5-dependent recombination DNA repair protein 1 homolog [Hemicordylus capensis]XP_053162426.1 swi5-dependent recombination DNA repair protein 1 homolog [Hemicordylus capensis]XP_053162427.1 swi5-dependent recombination DNA repair protein 1 homolog [Hemicordylus capensis]XP_053162428.1 swi5-dependent 
METPVLSKPTSICSTPENYEIPAHSSSSGKQPMSATLRERLKKARRSFNATLTVAKRLKINEDNNCGAHEEKVPRKEEPCSTSQDEGICLGKSSDETVCLKSALQERVLGEPEYTGCNKTTQNSPQIALLRTDCEQRELLEEKAKLVKQIQEKEELLRRLKLVKMYRSKNNPAELQSLIAKWRSSSQAMLYELQSALSTDGKKLSLTQLIDNFGLDDQLLHYIRTEETFM